MENIIPGLLNLGIGGAMLAAFLWFAWHLVTKVIPSMISAREQDLNWMRQEVVAARREGLMTLEKVEERHEKLFTQICARLEQIEAVLSKLAENK